MTHNELEHELTLDMIAEIDAKIPALKKWIDHLTEWRKAFCGQLAALLARSADRTPEEQEQVCGLKRSISNIDRGCEYWNGSAVVGPQLAALIKAHYRPTWDGPRDPWSAGHGSLPVAERLLESLQRERDSHTGDRE